MTEPLVDWDKLRAAEREREADIARYARHIARSPAELSALSADVMRYARHIARITEIEAPLGDIIRRAMLNEVRRLEAALAEWDEAVERAEQRRLASEAAHKIQVASVRRDATKGLTVAPKATVGDSGHRDSSRCLPRGGIRARRATG